MRYRKTRCFSLAVHKRAVNALVEEIRISHNLILFLFERQNARISSLMILNKLLQFGSGAGE